MNDGDHITKLSDYDDAHSAAGDAGEAVEVEIK